MAIQNFQKTDLVEFFLTGKAPKRAGWSSVARIATRKLDMLDYAAELEDLRTPPGNRLEALRGKLKGFNSIRINDQWRIVFRWEESGAGPEALKTSPSSIITTKPRPKPCPTNASVRRPPRARSCTRNTSCLSV